MTAAVLRGTGAATQAIRPVRPAGDIRRTTRRQDA
jgi:hypothetical protein